MKYILSTLIVMLVNYGVNGQSISLDNTGKISKIQYSKITEGSQVSFPSPTPGELFRDLAVDSCKKQLARKLDSLINYLDDQNPKLSFQFYTRFWGQQATQEVAQEFKWIREYLKKPALDTNLQHLKPFYQSLRSFFQQPSKNWFQVNNTTLAGSSYQVQPADLSTDDDAYKLDIKINLLYNTFIEKLFTATYTNASEMSEIRGMSFTDYDGERQKLNELRTSALELAKLNLNTVKDADIAKMDKLWNTFISLKIAKAIKDAPFFKNWLWWRSGELTLNPFEHRYKDLNKTNPGELFPAAKSTSTTGLLTRANFNLQSILLAKDNDGLRRIQYLQQLHGKGDQVSSISTPLKASENVQVVVHNINAGETAELVLVSSTPHNGMNNTMSMLDSALSTLGTAFGSLSSNKDALNAILSVLSGNKDAGDDLKLQQAHPAATQWPAAAGGREAAAWAALKADLEKQGFYNEDVMERTKKSAAANTLKKVIAEGKRAGYLRAMLDVINEYYLNLDIFVSRLNTFKTDSLVYATVFQLVYESNLPPDQLSMQDDDRPSGFSSRILYTIETEAKVTQTYEVKRYINNGGKKDSVRIASFKYKTSPKDVFGVSIGPAFTIKPTDIYGKNTVTENANDPLTIKTDRKLVHFTVGLNIYPFKIFTLDNNFIHSKASPAYERISVYLGLGFPKTLDNFYPGISYDLIAGIKVIGGVHCYMHDRYSIVNNVVKDKSSRFRAAGAFFSVNIDPRIAIKAAGIIK
ncbi:MAG: hypothetical protein ACTHMC_12540 [Pseudobacter sp.]|uniref:hypothetical protein n=1 Tax=Pseudobacter sp. TaxID=2045420 RepID=UPI003F8162D3